jgi:excisionase family DNA binding protein
VTPDRKALLVRPTVRRAARLDEALVLLTLAELAAALQVSKKQIYALTRDRTRNGIPRIRIGRGYRFFWGDVLDWLREHRDNRLEPMPLRGVSPSSGSSRRVLGRRRGHAPNKPLGGRPARKPGKTRVSANWPARVAARLPEGTPEGVPPE